MTLTDSQVIGLVKKIGEFEGYTGLGKRNPEIERLIKLRDQGLVSIAWLFIKRGGEYLRLQLKDVRLLGRELSVVYHIEKKQKRKKLCTTEGCGELNKLKAKFCSKCAADISAVEPIVVSAPSPRDVKKTKLLGTSPLIKFFQDWVQTIKDMGIEDQESYVFPRVLSSSEQFDFGHHIGVSRLDQILQKIDPSMTSHFFRYGHTEVLLFLDYTESEAKEAGDWEKEDMVHTYGKKVEQGKAAKKFAEETRAL